MSRLGNIKKMESSLVITLLALIGALGSSPVIAESCWSEYESATESVAISVLGITPPGDRVVSTLQHEVTGMDYNDGVYINITGTSGGATETNSICSSGGAWCSTATWESIENANAGISGLFKNYNNQWQGAVVMSTNNYSLMSKC